jgi:hypothetical protein
VSLGRPAAVLPLLVLGATPALAQGRRVTFYPFDAVDPGGPLRYVVAAEAASAAARRISSE